MMTPVNVTLSTSVNLIEIIPYRHGQCLVFQITLDTVKLIITLPQLNSGQFLDLGIWKTTFLLTVFNRLSSPP